MSHTEDEIYGPSENHIFHMRLDFMNFLEASRDAVVGFIEAACQNIYTSQYCRVVL
jgi:hypothetical protein